MNFFKTVTDNIFSIAYRSYDITVRFRFNPVRLVSLISSAFIKRTQLKDIKKIMLIRLDGIGDIVLFTPVLKLFRERFPNAEISVLVSSVGKMLLKSCPYIDVIIENDHFFKYEHEHQWKLSERIAFAKKIRRTSYDLSIDFRTDGRATDILFLLNSKYKAGYDVHGKGWFLNTKVYSRSQKHMTQKNLDVCRKLGLSVKDENPFWWYNERDCDNARSILEKCKTDRSYAAVVHAGAGESFKQWPADKFAQLCRNIVEKYDTAVIFIGGPSDKQKTLEIQSMIDSETYNYVNKLNFDELSCLFKLSDVFIGNDSGPMHLAAVSGVDTIVIQAYTTNPVWWAPASSKAVVLRPQKSCENDISGLSEISADNVLREYVKIIEKKEK